MNREGREEEKEPQKRTRIRKTVVWPCIGRALFVAKRLKFYQSLIVML